jgi:hypothetical protein
MAKKARNGKNTHSTSGLWIAPTSSLKQPLRESNLESSVGLSHQRVAGSWKLADIALGFKAPQRKRDEYKMKRGA